MDDSKREAAALKAVEAFLFHSSSGSSFFAAFIKPRFGRVSIDMAGLHEIGNQVQSTADQISMFTSDMNDKLSAFCSHLNISTVEA